ncbi:hypothetical protein EDB84DRAFT_1569516 [Lactarius hengduanensis]|nr:hypothetical protein EDB84DRAFT_1569516 [Lactarius hengduanensis]
MSTTSPTDSPMAGSSPDRSKVDAIYDLLADLPTVDNALVGVLNEPAPSLGDASPLALMGLAPFSFPPRPPPSTFTRELEALRDSLNLRLDAIEGLQAPPLPSAPMPATPTPTPASKPRAQKHRAQLPTPAPAKASPGPAPTPTPASRPTPPLPSTFASVVKTPARPSLVVSLRPPVAGASHPPAVRRSPQEVVSHLNAVLSSEGHLATLSAARWTAKNNLVVTAGPDTTVHHLTSASHLISECLATFLSADHSPLPVQTRDNSLLADNPAYRGLRLTQPPSWVRAPASYTLGSVSSLVLTFEDPSGDSLHSLLAGRTLFAFGHSGELKRWKAKPRHTGKAVPAASPSPP